MRTCEEQSNLKQTEKTWHTEYTQQRTVGNNYYFSGDQYQDMLGNYGMTQQTLNLHFFFAIKKKRKRCTERARKSVSLLGSNFWWPQTLSAMFWFVKNSLFFFSFHKHPLNANSVLLFLCTDINGKFILRKTGSFVIPTVKLLTPVSERLEDDLQLLKAERKIIENRNYHYNLFAGPKCFNIIHNTYFLEYIMLTLSLLWYSFLCDLSVLRARLPWNFR